MTMFTVWKNLIMSKEAQKERKSQKVQVKVSKKFDFISSLLKF